MCSVRKHVPRNFTRSGTLFIKKTQTQVFFSEFCKKFKNTFSTKHLWISASVIRTVECGILVFKKNSVNTLKIELYSLFLNMPIKHLKRKEKEKEI